MRSAWQRWQMLLLCLSLALLTSACATNNRAKWTPPAHPKSGPVKIGKPYEVNGVWYYPKDDRDYDKIGIASWYGPGFHGKYTANGEVYDQDDVTAAHKTLPMPSWVEVTNLENGRKTIARINDRGPFVGDRIIDLSRRTAQLLGVHEKGIAKVRVRRVYLDNMPVEYAEVAPRKVAPAIAAPLAAPKPTPAPAPVAMPVTTPVPSSPPVRTVAIPASDTKFDTSPLAGAAGPLHFIQVAAVSNAETAQLLVGKLSSYGSVQMELTSKGLYRVRVGPFADQEAATTALAKIRAAGYGDALVIPSLPSS